MRHSTAAALVIGLFFPAPELSVITQPRRVYAIVDVTVIPMDRERLLNHQVVIVRGDRIAEVGSMGGVRVPPAAVRIDGRNRYLLPGLFDMHAHVEDTTDMLLWLAKGFTTVRNLEGRPQHLQWRRSIRTGQLLGPDIFTSGPFTNLPGISTPEDARRAVIAQKAAGYDEIKIHGSLNADAYDTLCAVARRVEIPIVGHAVRNLPFDAMVRCGQADISHAEEFIYGYFAYDVSDSAARLIPRAADSTRRAGMHVTPTLVTYRRILAQVENLDSLMAVTPTRYVSPAELIMWQRENNRYIRNWPASTIPKLRARWRFQVELVRALFHAGVPLMSGSDAIGPTWVPGWASQEELRIFVQDIGMSPYEALRTATVIPAAFLGESNEVGTVAPGRRADLVLLEGNPLKDITQIDRIAGVLVRGRWLPRREIAIRLEAIARANKRMANQAGKIIKLGWRRAAKARCDSTSRQAAGVIRALNSASYAPAGNASEERGEDRDRSRRVLDEEVAVRDPPVEQRVAVLAVEMEIAELRLEETPLGTTQALSRSGVADRDPQREAGRSATPGAPRAGQGAEQSSSAEARSAGAAEAAGSSSAAPSAEAAGPWSSPAAARSSGQSSAPRAR